MRYVPSSIRVTPAVLVPQINAGSVLRRSLDQLPFHQTTPQIITVTAIMAATIAFKNHGPDRITRDGIFEPFLELGDAVKYGQSIGQIHFVTQPAWPPQPVLVQTEGMLISRRAFPLTKQGECVAVIARPFAL